MQILFIAILGIQYASTYQRLNATSRPSHTRVGFISPVTRHTPEGRLITGTVKVYHAGRWGTVCDDRFDEEDAEVLCRQMGFRHGMKYRIRHPYYQRLPQAARMVIWLDNVYCNGTESDIADCRHNGWGRHNCGHHEDQTIGCANFRIPGPTRPPPTRPLRTWRPTEPLRPISCRFPTRRPPTWRPRPTWRPTRRTYARFISPVRRIIDTYRYNRARTVTVGGRTTRIMTGTVAVYHNGRWGTICDDRFDRRDAEVLCRQMGYSHGIEYPQSHPFSQNLTEAQNMTIWMDNVECTGRESNIAYCRHNGWGRHNCNHREDVSIGCSHSYIPSPTRPPRTTWQPSWRRRSRRSRRSRRYRRHTGWQPTGRPDYTRPGSNEYVTYWDVRQFQHEVAQALNTIWRGLREAVEDASRNFHSRLMNLKFH